MMPILPIRPVSTGSGKRFYDDAQWPLQSCRAEVRHDWPMAIEAISDVRTIGLSGHCFSWVGLMLCYY